MKPIPMAPKHMYRLLPATPVTSVGTVSIYWKGEHTKETIKDVLQAKEKTEDQK